MNKVLRYLGLTIVALLATVLVIVGIYYAYFSVQSMINQNKSAETPTIKINGFTFRDLNKNGQLDIYEDNRHSKFQRIEDLLSQMTLQEKAGVMFINSIAVSSDGALQELPNPNDLFSIVSPSNSEYVVSKLMNHFNIIFLPEPDKLAKWVNNLQKLAEGTRLGIPVTIATDPRHAFGLNPAASLPAEHFSLWPEPMGLAAARDPAMVEEFGNIARQEYLAVGIRLALHPMADLATEPRWARAAGTFGEDAELSAQTVYAYVKGFQGDELGPDSVATMVKHFTGGGPQKDGEDAHFNYGKEQVYPGDNFDYHLIPFEKGAFAAKTAQIMPYYGIPLGQTDENVGFAFNKTLLTKLLREKYGFEGVICSDWGVISDMNLFGIITILEARAWGVEHLTKPERMLKSLNAGIDQFGGEQIPEMLVELVTSGQVDEKRLDESVRRLLRDKFTLGLFDNPYVDPEQAKEIVGKEKFRQAGIAAQRKSLILLKNESSASASALPLTGKSKIYIENFDPMVAAKYGQVVELPTEADFAIIRIAAPFEPRDGFASFFHAGDLDFKAVEKKRILDLLNTVPTIVNIYLDRAAVIPDIAEKSVALIANFGATDEVLLDMIFGKSNPTGKLPFEMPSSMEAVRNQMEDVPYDSVNPTFPFGHGLSYE